MAFYCSVPFSTLRGVQQLKPGNNRRRKWNPTTGRSERRRQKTHSLHRHGTLSLEGRVSEERARRGRRRREGKGRGGRRVSIGDRVNDRRPECEILRVRQFSDRVEGGMRFLLREIGASRGAERIERI